MQDDEQQNTDFKTLELVNHMRDRGSLPALNENVRDIAVVTHQRGSSAADLAAVIMRDCGLSSNILSTVNSSFYSPKYPIKTISSAVVLLGFEKVHSLALGLSIFKQNMISESDQELLKLYASSYFTGSLAMSLAIEAGSRNPEEIFVAGLLYQLPMLALAYTFPRQFQEMESMAAEEGKSLNSACGKIFGVQYDNICHAVAEMYRVPGKIEDILKNKDSEDSMLNLVKQASLLSGMLFGARKGGKDELSKMEMELRGALKQEKLSISQFIKDSCGRDPNISRFFNLSKDDVEMMVNILEWGKANPASVISKLKINLLDDAVHGDEAATPEAILARYLNELFVCRRGTPDVNQILMLAQESIYRCFPDVDVFAAFFDSGRKYLKGKLYAGDNLLLRAADFFVESSAENSPIIKCCGKRDTLVWDAESGSARLKLPKQTEIRLRPHHAMMAPITVGAKAIGVYFISRPSERKFDFREQTWFEQILESVEMGLAKIRSGAAHLQ